ncbi:hypothetical protein AB1Y20_012052 [Prymnesium parvum]|uniref:Uncharacterized protein n=1 Tax=Prymnesium parvum TaxID=97485 RepID=A0AB34IQ80_PRYPA
MSIPALDVDMIRIAGKMGTRGDGGVEGEGDIARLVRSGSEKGGIRREEVRMDAAKALSERADVTDKCVPTRTQLVATASRRVPRDSGSTGSSMPSARGKSFAQHLLEIEQEAARAASRIRMAHTRASQSLPHFDASLEPSRAAADDFAAPPPAAAEAARLRCELRVLRASLPEMEEAAEASAALWRASLSQQQSLARGRAEQERRVASLEASLARLHAEKAALAARAAAQSRELEAMRAAMESMAAGALGDAPPPPPARAGGGGGPHLGSPPSPLLWRLDETRCGTRARAHWRRAAAYLALASIGDYWQSLARRRRRDAPPPPPRGGGALSALSERGGVAKLEEAARAALVGEALRRRLEAEEAEAAAEEEAALWEAAARAVAEAGGEARGAELRRAAWLREEVAAAPRRARALVAALRRVVEPNLPPLEEHLRTVAHDRCAAAVRALQAAGGAAAEEEARGKAREVIALLEAKVSRAAEQFVDGMRGAVAAEDAAALGPRLVARLCEQAVAARCEPMRRMASEEELHARVWEEVRVVQGFVLDVAQKGTKQWLSELVLGATTLDMPPELYEFIATAVAVHLDPYIDGEITSPEEERTTEPMLSLVQSSYAQEFGRQLPAPPELVLAIYVVYAISKSNALHCFGEVVMGQGRLPVVAAEVEEHVVALGKALVLAIERDFGREHNSIQGVPLSAPLIETLAREHSTQLFVAHHHMSERLAEANRVGEIGRKEEVKRIFGLDI